MQREFNRSSTALARSAIQLTAFLALVGSVIGVFGITMGVVTGIEAVLVLSSLVFSGGLLAILLLWKPVEMQGIAITATAFFGVYLSACSIVAICGTHDHLNVISYLIWFFPLLGFNRLVNSAVAARYMERLLILAPLIILGGCSLRLRQIFPSEILLLLIAYLISYVAHGLVLNKVSRHREAYIAELGRAETRRVESQVLESISDCFISLDAAFCLIYVNDAACAEFAVARAVALGSVLSSVAPGFLSQPMRAGLQAAMDDAKAATFEAQNESETFWYEIRCFPRPGGMSVYFRNITQAISARRTLEDAHGVLREQAQLLDKAQEAIAVLDIQQRFLFWNKGAQILYGWTAEEVRGRAARDLFYSDTLAFDNAVVKLLRDGEWVGELTQRRKDGATLIVESRWTLVTSEDGMLRSVLSISTDISKRKAAESEIQYLAFYDQLTGLANRLLLHDRLKEALADATSHGKKGAFFLVDLDNFKRLNDTLGHDIGDMLLQQVAVRLKSCVSERDTVARVGGDEFIVLLQDLNEGDLETAAQAKIVGERIMAAFHQPYQVGNYEWSSTPSIGITLFDGSAAAVDDLLKRADLAMYRAKANGRNAMCFFDPEMQTFASSRVSLEADLRAAVLNRELQLLYQPQVDSIGNVMGAEALLRWHHPVRGLVSPSQFIPLAEETGLIVEIGHWVLEAACSQLVDWAKDAEMRELDLAVNVSVRQFLDPRFVNLVRSLLEQTGANPRRLKLEITESLIMENVDSIADKMTTLRADGVRFSLDDFGTGYSSLSQLKRLPFDQLKIDRSFVTDVVTNSRDASIVLAIIALGRSLGLMVIAEGVETEFQRDFLAQHGCHDYQGFLFSRPLTSAQFKHFYEACLFSSRCATLSLH
jgi:diguanylate cyclase (GGDEF)-like protein/PAS domain S-box-containing protein